MDSERRISCSEAIGLTEMNRLRVPGMGSGLGDIAGVSDGDSSKLGKSEFRRSLRRINSLTRRKLSPNGRAGGSITPRKNSRCSVSGGGGDGHEHSEEETSFLNEKCDSLDQWSNNQKQRKKERS